MPSIVKGSISILSDAGLGMAMFSLGNFHLTFLWGKKLTMRYNTITHIYICILQSLNVKI